MFKTAREKQLERENTDILRRMLKLQDQVEEQRDVIERLKGQYYQDRSALRNANKGLLRLSRKCKRLQKELDGCTGETADGGKFLYPGAPDHTMHPSYGGIKPLKFTVPAGVNGLTED